MSAFTGTLWVYPQNEDAQWLHHTHSGYKISQSASLLKCQSFSSIILLFVFLEMNLCERILSKSGRILTYLLKLWQHLLSFPMLQGLKMQPTLLLRCGKKKWLDSFCHHNKSGISLESPPFVSSRKVNKPKIQFSLNLFCFNNLSRLFGKCGL